MYFIEQWHMPEKNIWKLIETINTSVPDLSGCVFARQGKHGVIFQFLVRFYGIFKGIVYFEGEGQFLFNTRTLSQQL